MSGWLKEEWDVLGDCPDNLKSVETFKKIKKLHNSSDCAPFC